MSAMDAFFLYAEDDGVNHQHVAGLLLFEGPPPPFDDVLAMVASKLPVLRRYRQVVKEVPMNLGRPVWVDDPNFDLEYHLRRTAVPSPGGDAELAKLHAQFLSERLDRTRPLWELMSVEGLADGRWALLSKTHHAMVDGVSGTDLTSVLLDRSPNPEPAADVTWTPDPMPTPAELITDAVGEMVRSPAEQMRALQEAANLPGGLMETLTAGIATAAKQAAVEPSATSLNGPIGPKRRYAFTKYTLDEVKEIRTEIGGTVNDIVLAAATRGFRDLLLSRGEMTEGRMVRIMVPIALHARDASGRAVHAGDGQYENKATAVVAELPVSIEDPLERARLIHEQLKELKASPQVAAGDTLSKLSGFAPATFLSVGVRAAAAMPPQTAINSVVSNVPGPQMTLYAVGRRLVESYPCPPVFPIGARTGVAIWSYDGVLHFGINADHGSVPDIDVLRDGILAGFRELHDLVAKKAVKPKKKRTAKNTARAASA
jgi:WS/DGAT/MGAT family acyltransferase